MSTAKSALSTIYTLTPTHCGTGQAAGAVDLPIAREKHTELPVLPGTTLKGVARDAFEKKAGRDDSALKQIFGPKIVAGGTAEDHHAGKLVFCEGKLLAFPGRSLNRPFFFVTCPLIVERLARDLRAFGFDALAKKATLPEEARRGDDQRAWMAEQDMAGKPLVIEDLVYSGANVRAAGEVRELGKLFAGWLPPAEDHTRGRLARSLLVLPDVDFLSLVQRAVPVQARVALTGGKTTDKWKNEEGKEESGNLWYEEALPSDCLFVAFVTERAQQRQCKGNADGARETPEWSHFWGQRGTLASVQIGGNETVGYGRCWWNAAEQGAVQ